MSDVQSRLRALVERWATAKAAERANAQLYLSELTEALGVERPRPAGSGYEFELPVRVVNRDGSETTNFADLVKLGHFLLEAKDDESGKSPEVLLRKAFGQARSYAANLPGAQPPYLMVLDVGRKLIVWDRWSGSYGGFSAGKAINLRTLHEREADFALLRDIWEDPKARDPRAKAEAVTKEIAGTLAELANSLEGRGHNQEEVARYLMRVVFTMFAEDVGLLPDEPFRQAIEQVGLRGTPEEFSEAVSELWAAMDEGRRFGLRKLLRFNGHFFKDRGTIPLTRADLATLERAARADWQHVEPTIFGTLLTRALDPEERHRLGAEYTPRAFIERLVRPTVEEPIRERWTAVQAEVLQLRESGKKKERDTAVKRLDDFHDWLKSLRFLDPACGSGNFLYVTLNVVKNVELEVIRAREEITGEHLLRMEEVSPAQFHGIEVKPWAREIAELTLWIGFHQFWRAHHDVQPPEPVLRDTGTLEQRDAVLAWDEIRHDRSRDRPDPTPRVRHPVTGELVPDPNARLPYMEYVNARPAEWPEAEFIVGNPPYLGEKRQRDVLGDGYIDALRAAYTDLPETADYVTYWWHRAAEEVASGRTIRAGLITTNKLTQARNRVEIERAASHGAIVTWAIPDHVWYDGADGAEVRVAMTVIAKEPQTATLVLVEKVERVKGEVAILSQTTVRRLNADLTAQADVAGAAHVPLLAASGLASQGVKLVGDGFLLDADEAQVLSSANSRNGEVIKHFRNGKDVTDRTRNAFVIDFALRDEQEARTYAELFDIVRTRVKPSRDSNPHLQRRTCWWRLGTNAIALREAISSLPRYIATSEVSKHTTFVFLASRIIPDGSLVCIASEDAFVFGVLSSSVHRAWANATGGRMGVRHTPRYSKRASFDPFPFPDPPPSLRAKIADVAERLDRHRAEALARDERVTMTGMYNVVEKLRSGAELTKKEREVHTLAACGVLRDLHDELDRLVAEAYGWSWPEPPAIILERLVALHDERVEEERRGKVRWLRPEYQIPRFAEEQRDEQLSALGSRPSAEREAGGSREPRAESAPLAWPSTAIGQIAALEALVESEPLTVAEAAARFAGAKPEIVARHLETLAIMGELKEIEDGRYAALAGVG